MSGRVTWGRFVGGRLARDDHGDPPVALHPAFFPIDWHVRR